MKVFLTCINAEAQHHLIEKGGLIQDHAPRAVIIASLEVQLIDAGLISLTLQQRRIATPIAVGEETDNMQQLLVFDPVQIDADGAAGQPWAASSTCVVNFPKTSLLTSGHGQAVHQ